MKVCINGGHFPGRDPGALGSRVKEADVCMRLMQRVAGYLEKAGCEVMAVQTDDLGEICNVSNRWGADLFISIHCNACLNHNARGTETFAFSRTGDKLAHHIQSQVVSSIGTVDRGIKEAGFYVLKHTKCPAVLVECAFIDNVHDEALLIEREDEFARAIARGVTDYITRKQ
ncbi:MAG: N-acetylmuramoyl-L-alanine amidase [Selenomonadales bacterium]|nr:N-acetylmuramoyl-L-alanine amidase [Selenomonadales bacterium]